MSNDIGIGSWSTGKRVANQINPADQKSKNGEAEPLPLFHAQQIKKSFFKGKKEIPVIRGVDLKIKPGELVAITGASGVGKSTLLHILGTLEPPTSGRVLFGPKQEDIFKLSEKALSVFRNRTLGFVFQFHYLLPEFTALENVMMPTLIAGYKRQESEKQAKGLLDFVGLKDRMDHRPSELSGGEQQRVAIARAVILRPKILMADELTGNLDSENCSMVMELLVRLNRSTGVSVLLVTHDQALASKMHRIIVMKDGVFVN
jgi:lipoprotein-releasing system ATP-binding protein